MDSDRIQFVLLSLTIIILLAGGFYNYQDEKSTESDIVEVEGEILNSSIENKTVDGYRHTKRKTYRPVVNYSYEFRGDKYVGDDIWFRDTDRTYHSYSRAAKAVDDYKVGNTVSVKINSIRPSESYLESTITENGF